MKYVNKQLNDLDKMKNSFLLRMCFLHTCCVFMMCGMFYSSIVCLYVYAYDVKSKVHSENALGPGHLRVTLLLRTTRMRSDCSGVATIQTKIQDQSRQYTNVTVVFEIRFGGG